MKIVCIFAHPDDEAFGPGATIAKYAKDHEVYIICATRGEAGKNHIKDSEGELSAIREKEFLTSTKILGVKQTFFLDYVDGTLSNNLYHEIATKLNDILTSIKPDILLTYEPHGISGHLDHIAMSMITTFVYQKLTFVKKLYYYCINKSVHPARDDYFIYFPEGYDDDTITTVIDTEEVWDKKVESMMAHKSQRADAEGILARSKDLPKKDYFILAMHRLSNISLPETDLMNGV